MADCTALHEVKVTKFKFNIVQNPRLPTATNLSENQSTIFELGTERSQIVTYTLYLHDYLEHPVFGSVQRFALYLLHHLQTSFHCSELIDDC